MLNPRAMRNVRTHSDDSESTPNHQLPMTNSQLPGVASRLGNLQWPLELEVGSRELRGDVTTPCSHLQGAVLDLDSNGVPSAVLLAGARVAQVVLLAQLVGDTRGRAVEVAEPAHDFRPTASVVGDLAQRLRVYALVVAPRPDAAA